MVIDFQEQVNKNNIVKQKITEQDFKNEVNAIELYMLINTDLKGALKRLKEIQKKYFDSSDSFINKYNILKCMNHIYTTMKDYDNEKVITKSMYELVNTRHNPQENHKKIYCDTLIAYYSAHQDELTEKEKIDLNKHVINITGNNFRMLRLISQFNLHIISEEYKSARSLLMDIHKNGVEFDYIKIVERMETSLFQKKIIA